MSWSGNVSREAAENLSTFIEHVVRGVNTFVSTQSIEAGERWETRLSEELNHTHHAILCITRENLTSPWLNYEAGALSKLIDRSRIIPYTLGFPPSQMAVGPLSRFQAVESDNVGTWRLIQALNNSLESPNKEAFVQEDFDLWWPRFSSKMKETLATKYEDEKFSGPTEREILLELRRDLQRVLANTSIPVFNNNEKEPEIIEKHLLDDPLTNLPNRRSLQEYCKELSKNNNHYVIGFMDLDNFKSVNDALGHNKGDELLMIVASAIQIHLDSADFFARVGGDEFVAIFLNTTQEKAAEELTVFIEKLAEYTDDSGFPPLTASCGVSSDGAAIFEDKLRSADTAMYEAKKNGRGIVKLASKQGE